MLKAQVHIDHQSYVTYGSAGYLIDDCLEILWFIITAAQVHGLKGIVAILLATGYYPLRVDRIISIDGNIGLIPDYNIYIYIYILPCFGSTLICSWGI